MMKNLILTLCLASACSLGSANLSAQNLKQRELIAHDREKVADLAKETNLKCGTKITFSVDYPSFAHVSEDVNNQNPWAYLANATDALKHFCLTEEGKKAVQSKITSVTVSHAEAESESLANGAFHYSVPYSGHSPATVIKWLEEKL